ncbi:hypothetical protein [Rhizobium sp. SGZ-381]|uniref:hypothetical protein n=1 Tax=Rhizobium sp. SGZ-381 TaxID=3342800 RepID=UPI00366EDF81
MSKDVFHAFVVDRVLENLRGKRNDPNFPLYSLLRSPSQNRSRTFGFDRLPGAAASLKFAIAAAFCFFKSGHDGRPFEGIS